MICPVGEGGDQGMMCHALGICVGMICSLIIMKIKFKPNLARPQGARGSNATRSSPSKAGDTTPSKAGDTTSKGHKSSERQKSSEESIEELLPEKSTGL